MRDWGVEREREREREISVRMRDHTDTQQRLERLFPLRVIGRHHLFAGDVCGNFTDMA